MVGPGGSGMLNGITAIGAGAYFSAAPKNDGTTWRWGQNTPVGVFTPLHPRQLPIPSSLVSEPISWQYAYDATLDDHDPRGSGFASEEQRDAFAEDGRRLWRELIRVLGGSFHVECFDPLTHQLLGSGQS